MKLCVHVHLHKEKYLLTTMNTVFIANKASWFASGNTWHTDVTKYRYLGLFPSMQTKKAKNIYII